MAGRIKGYLPLRIQLEDSITFIYIKEHSDDTLFATNCPVYPNVDPEKLLYSIFGRYGDVHRIHMTGNPRRFLSSQQSEEHEQQQQDHHPKTTATSSYDKKFAHVTYKSAKELKSALSTFFEIMATASSSNEAPMITIDAVELQTLQDQSQNEDDEMNEEEPHEPLEGIHAVVARYRQSLPDRDALLAACNATMDEYEAGVAARSKKPTVDDDGFIAVSYTKKDNATRDELMEQQQGGLDRSRGRTAAAGSTGRTSSGKSRSRNKKQKKEVFLKDFYRFQTKEYRKKEVQELRERFEQDLAKAKALQEKPF
jgi:ribosomal RNA-processing protein 7